MNLIINDKQLQMYYNNKIVAVHMISNKVLNILPEHQLNYPKYLFKKTYEEKEIILKEMENIRYDND